MVNHPNRKLFNQYKKLYKQGYTREEIAVKLRLYSWGELRLYSDMMEEETYGEFFPYTKHEKFPIHY
jgi:hypothetical protein